MKAEAEEELAEVLEQASQAIGGGVQTSKPANSPMSLAPMKPRTIAIAGRKYLKSSTACKVAEGRR